MTALANGCPQQLADTLPAGGSFLAVIAEEPVAVPRVEDIPEAVRLARIALGAATPEAPVAVFGRSPLTRAAIADPAARRGVVQVVLGGLEGLARDYCDILLDTLAVWSAHNGSAVEAATYLYCHPNTVRYRLRRIEERTGRSLSDPRAVAELLLALEAHRHSAA